LKKLLLNHNYLPENFQKHANGFDKNLDDLFVEHIPQHCTFTPIKGYKFLKCGDKPQFSSQLVGTYANQLWAKYPAQTTMSPMIQANGMSHPLIEMHFPTQVFNLQ